MQRKGKSALTDISGSLFCLYLFVVLQNAPLGCIMEM